MKIKTDYEGWDCVPELEETVDLIKELDHHFYEIKNCVRTQSTEDIVFALRSGLLEAIGKLDEIDTDIEYVTKYEDNEEE